MSVVDDAVKLEPGNYASLFISERPLAPPGYGEVMNEMMSAAEQMEGYLGFESLRNGEDGIFISYWKDASSVEAWAAHAGHRMAKSRGTAEWYDAFRSVLCKVEKTTWFRRAVSPAAK